MAELSEPVDVRALAAELMADLPNHSGRRTAKSVLHGDTLRAVVIALGADAVMADHEAPGPATIHVLAGEVDFRAGEESVRLGAGSMLPIPPVVHNVHARTDSAFLLTVCLPG